MKEFNHKYNKNNGDIKFTKNPDLSEERIKKINELNKKLSIDSYDSSVDTNISTEFQDSNSGIKNENEILQSIYNPENLLTNCDNTVINQSSDNTDYQ